MTKDLLGGAAPELVGLQQTGDGADYAEPQAIPEKVCAAYLEDGGKVLLSVADGLEADPGLIVFLADKTGPYHLCNAIGDAMIWGFEPIGVPIELPTQVS